jgi:ribonuclease BN (tRNA processing enzyme)
MPDANGANSGYLLTHGGFALLLDCGSGVFSKLRGSGDPLAVDAVLITHLHADHMLDLIPYAHALGYWYRDAGRRPRLLAPPGARAAFAQLGVTLSFDALLEETFAIEEYAPDAEVAVGPFKVRFAEVPHFIPAWACDVTAADGHRFTFGADCASNDAIVELARGTDLLMLEATEGPEPQQHPPGAVHGHMSAREAGELARRANAARLVLTHYSDELDASALRAAGEAAFGRPVALAEEGARYEL